MTSQESMSECFKRTLKLVNLFRGNVKRAEAKMVVEDSPVDYLTYKFICSIQDSKFMAVLLMFESGLMDISSRDDYANERKLVKELHSLEEILASQNEYLDNLVSMKVLKMSEEEKKEESAEMRRASLIGDMHEAVRRLEERRSVRCAPAPHMRDPIATLINVKRG